MTVNVYDVDGRLQKTIAACKNTTPPASWWLCTGTATADWQTNLTTSYTYDAAGRKLSEKAPDPSSTGVGQVTTRYAYDGAGRLCRVLEAATTDLQGLADPCATAVSGTTIANVSTRYLYDDNGNLTTMIDANGHQTSYGYDPSGRMTSLTDADGKTVTWTYDAAGNRMSQTNRTTANTQIVWTYDELNRMTSRTADGVTTSYTYDGNGNRLTAGDGTRTITTAYDPLNRPTSVTTSDDAGAATSTTYSFSAPSWTDPSGAYAATLDPFGRQTSVTDPIHPGAPFTTTYGADGQPSAMTAQNGNATAFTSDQAGRPLTRTTTGTGGVARASYVWTRNAAGVVRSETSTITGDTSNGTASYGDDPLSRLTTFTAPPGVTNQTTSWEAVPNRASLQTGTGTPITTSYDSANRPLSDSGGGSYTSDFDGRLLTMPGHVLTYDSLGRLTSDTTAGARTDYTYDPLDRLRTVTRSGSVQRFRYVGATSAMAQVLDGAGSVIRSFGTDWTGTHLLDWTGTGANQRIYGTNGHGDVTWTADGTGVVTASARYDPWGVRQVSTGSLPDFRFQGSWFDSATNLSWAVNRWYAPSLGRFVTEDSLLGYAEHPATRHLYSYGGGEPVAHLDRDGRFWYRWRAGDTYVSVARRWLGDFARWPAIVNSNLNRLTLAQARTPYGNTQLAPGTCVWLPKGIYFLRDGWGRCVPRVRGITGDISGASDWRTKAAADTVLGYWKHWYAMTPDRLYSLTRLQTKRAQSPYGSLSSYRLHQQWGDDFALEFPGLWAWAWGSRFLFEPANMILVSRPPLWVRLGWPAGVNAMTLGHYVFLEPGLTPRTASVGLLSHEYIHVLQWQGRGAQFGGTYDIVQGSSPAYKEESIAYLWEGWVRKYHQFGRPLPWQVFRPLPR